MAGGSALEEARMWRDFLTALCLVLVLEGILPFLVPERWQRMMSGIGDLSPRQVRLAALASMVLGTLCLYLVRQVA